jgi:hypothetical protein
MCLYLKENNFCIALPDLGRGSQVFVRISIDKSMEEIIYSNVQSKSGLDHYVVCSARTSINSRIVAGSNYEVVYFTTVPTLPIVIRTTGGGIPTKYWAVSIVSGGYATSAEAQAWIDASRPPGYTGGSINCVADGSTV